MLILSFKNVDDQSGTKLKMAIYCIEILILPVERIFLLNEAKDQQTLNNDNTSDTLLTSPIWSLLTVAYRYPWVKSTGKACTNPCTILKTHKFRISLFTKGMADPIGKNKSLE